MVEFHEIVLGAVVLFVGLMLTSYWPTVRKKWFDKTVGEQDDKEANLHANPAILMGGVPDWYFPKGFVGKPLEYSSGGDGEMIVKVRKNGTGQVFECRMRPANVTIPKEKDFAFYSSFFGSAAELDINRRYINLDIVTGKNEVDTSFETDLFKTDSGKWVHEIELENEQLKAKVKTLELEVSRVATETGELYQHMKTSTRDRFKPLVTVPRKPKEEKE